MKQVTNEDMKTYFGEEIEEFKKLDSGQKTNFFTSFSDSFYKKKNVLNAIKTVSKEIKSLSKKEVNILIVGASGSGKSETINALLKEANIENQKALSKSGGNSVTMDIESFKIGNCTIYDSPGLGDNLKKEDAHISKLVDKLKAFDKHGNELIDLVILVLNASNFRNLKSEYQLINDILIPNMKNNQNLIIAINKVDQFDDGDYWNKQKNEPEEQLLLDLKVEIENLKSKIKDSTGVEIEPIYYSAGRKERNKKPWNLIKLYDEMNTKVSVEKKMSLASEINDNKDNFKNTKNYEHIKKKIKDDIENTVTDKIKTKVEEKTNLEKEDEPTGWLTKIIGVFLASASWFGL